MLRLLDLTLNARHWRLLRTGGGVFSLTLDGDTLVAAGRTLTLNGDTLEAS